MEDSIDRGKFSPKVRLFSEQLIRLLNISLQRGSRGLILIVIHVSGKKKKKNQVSDWQASLDPISVVITVFEQQFLFLVNFL